MDEASRALAEMQRRQRQTLERGSPRRAPAWFTYGSAAGLLLVWASGDCEGWASGALAVGGVLVIVALTVALERVTGVRLRLRGTRWWPMALLAAAMLVAAIVVGSVLRYYDVPLDGTLGGLAGTLVWIAGLGPVQAASVRGPRDPA